LQLSFTVFSVGLASPAWLIGGYRMLNRLCSTKSPAQWLAIIAILTVGSCLSVLTTAAPAAVLSTASVGRLQSIPTRIAHRFTFAPPASAGAIAHVYIAGDFNNWSPTETPMRQIDPGHWAITLHLTPGIHYYKFVINGTNWIPDPKSNPHLSVPDGNGGMNSGVRIASAWQKMPLPKANIVPMNEIAFSRHNTVYYDVVNRHELRLSLSARSSALSRASVVIQSAGTWHQHVLRPELTHADATLYGALITRLSSPADYFFKLTHGRQTLYLANNQYYLSAAAARSHPYVSRLRPLIVTPRWTHHAIWYEIFPERFFNGNKANDPSPHIPWRWSWFKPYRPAGEHGNFYSYVFNRFYGGDIQGIADKLGYLQQLGVNTLYLTPIFVSPSIHKYDPWDYRHVDDGFGIKGSLKLLKGERIRHPSTWQWSKSDKVFLHFVKQAHRRHFRVVLDVPFGHCGVGFGPFQNVLKYGRKSPYAGWFQIVKWSPHIVYRSWGGLNGDMPNFRHYRKTGLAPGLCRYFFAITRRWMAPDGNVADGINGWRVDSAQTVPHAFWIAWRKVVKSINPKAVIIGEIWPPAQSYLNKGNQFDGVMNYPFATICTEFFADRTGNGGIGIGPKRFGRKLEQMLNWYSWQTDLTQQNLLDSQDTDRFVSRIVNLNLPFNADDRLQTNPNYSSAKPTPYQYKRFKQVVAFQMSFVGAPMIWYGDEVGMWGASDPSDRQPMVWKSMEPYDDPQVTVNESLLTFYRRAIAMRRQLPALQTGEYGELLASSTKDVFAFYRSLNGSNVYVILNRSAQPHRVTLHPFKADVGKKLYNYLSPRDFRLIVQPRSAIHGRPRLQWRRSAKPITALTNLRLRLRPWQTIVLARKTAQPD
jgi:cyclomaltodextrinase